jgi:glutamate 5-kinase
MSAPENAAESSSPPSPATTFQTLKDARTIVIKIGSALVTDQNTNSVYQDWLNAFAWDVAELCKAGKDIIIVSSGGIALGRSALGISDTISPGNIPLEQKQAASAVGQFHLFSGFYNAFSTFNMTIGQVLLTMAETENRRTHLNARETLKTLVERGAVPIINENDAVSTEEIRFGNNDTLAVRVGQMLDADCVVLLSTADGLYTADPNIDKNAKFFDVIEEITDEHIDMAGDAIAGLSTGGMKSKIDAALSATRAGIPMIITKGTKQHSLKALTENKKKRSTLFVAHGGKNNARKTWIQSHLNPKGNFFIDTGAVEALKNGSSLLPIGVKRMEGEFERGDAVEIKTLQGYEVGIGLTAYGSDDAKMIIGKKGDQIEKELGYAGRVELIHRNDMALQD